MSRPLEVRLDPVDNQRLARLCGALDANLRQIESALDVWPTLESAVQERIKERAAELEKSHKRVRQAVSLKVRQLTLAPQLPPDLLGILVLQPVV